MRDIRGPRYRDVLKLLLGFGNGGLLFFSVVVSVARVLIGRFLSCACGPEVAVLAGGCFCKSVWTVSKVIAVSLEPYRFWAQPVAICSATGLSGVVFMESMVVV